MSTDRIYCIILVLSLSLFLSLPAGRVSAGKLRSFSTVEELQKFYESIGDSPQEILRQPSILVKSFPSNFSNIRSVKQKKKLFKRIVLPLVVRENKRLTRCRNWLRRIKKLLATEKEMSKLDRVFTRRMLLRYKVYESTDDLPDKFSVEDLSKLLKRVHTLPPSLVLAQAANESAWGGSRFCQKANNIFGEWIYNRDAGLKPEGVPDTAPYRVKVFPSLQASVRSYMHNINTHWAYEDLRELRANQSDQLNSLKLVQGLENYSERGEAYVQDISSLIRSNNYRRYDSF